LVEDASRHTLALNPLVDLSGKEFLESTGTIFNAAIRNPGLVAEEWLAYIGELGEVVSGKASRTLEPGDKRFNAPAWKAVPFIKLCFVGALAAANQVGNPLTAWGKTK
jgi:polyhydroxyalkanoate synthase subunit PhaC